MDKEPIEISGDKKVFEPYYGKTIITEVQLKRHMFPECGFDERDSRVFFAVIIPNSGSANTWGDKLYGVLRIKKPEHPNPILSSLIQEEVNYEGKPQIYCFGSNSDTKVLANSVYHAVATLHKNYGNQLYVFNGNTYPWPKSGVVLQRIKDSQVVPLPELRRA
ncbi:MAG: hypothetical protein WC045_00460 [Patescibacteria group bacterium]